MRIGAARLPVVLAGVSYHLSAKPSWDLECRVPSRPLAEVSSYPDAADQLYVLLPDDLGLRDILRHQFQLLGPLPCSTRGTAPPRLLLKRDAEFNPFLSFPTSTHLGHLSQWITVNWFSAFTAGYLSAQSSRRPYVGVRWQSPSFRSGTAAGQPSLTVSCRVALWFPPLCEAPRIYPPWDMCSRGGRPRRGPAVWPL
jgi:hypothetical protein